MNIVKIDINNITPYKNNAKIHTLEQIEQIKKSIEEFGMNDPIAVWGEDNIIVEGHGRLEALKQLGYTEVDCIRLDHLTDEERKAYTLAHNKLTMNTDFDFDILNSELEDIADIDMSDFGFNLDFNINLIKKENEPNKGILQEKFLAPPFSILNASKGYWSERKKKWIQLGIKSGNGRKTEVHTTAFTEGYKGFENQEETTSIFDPVLCEIIYKWFNIEKGKIIDPFAGGSVRGIVAEKLGYKYTGIDLREEQVNANIKNANELNLKPIWICDDSINIDKYIDNESQDLFFTCPPYFDLEKYSDLKNDLSNMKYDEFIKTYEEIIKKGIKKVKENRFLAIVVGDIRDEEGFYRNFIGDTKKIFIESGVKLYNEIIYIQPIGSAVLRADKQFSAYRKNVKIHENVLIFYKGSIKEIKKNYKDIEIKEIEGHEEI